MKDRKLAVKRTKVLYDNGEPVHSGGGERPPDRRQRRAELHRTFPPQMHHVTSDITNQHTHTLIWHRLLFLVHADHG